MDHSIPSTNRSAYPAPTPPDALTYREFLPQNPAEGFLKIQASRAQRALPTPDVEIFILQQFNDQRVLFFRGKTDEDGLIDNIILPAPPRRDSLQSANAGLGARYLVYADHADFVAESHEIEIFEGITSILPIVMQLPQENEPWQ